MASSGFTNTIMSLHSARSFWHLFGNFAVTLGCLYMLKVDGPPLTDFLLAGLFALASGFTLFSRADLASSEIPSWKTARLLLLFLFCLDLACATSAVWLGVNPEQPATEEETGVNTRRTAVGQASRPVARVLSLLNRQLG